MIPKLIHYCWVSEILPETIPETIPAAIPKVFITYLQSWKKLTGYQFMLWNFNRFDINSSVWVKEAFEAKKYAFAADFIRLYAVYNYGGIYLDMDIEVIKPFDDLLNNDIMFARSNNIRKNIEAGCFGAEKHSPYIKKVLDYYEGRHFIKKDGSYDTRPVTLNMRDIFHKSFPEIENNIYSSDYFTIHDSSIKKPGITKNTYTIHHYVGSWLSETEKKNYEFTLSVRRILGCNMISDLVVILIFICKKIKENGFFSTLYYYIKKTKDRLSRNI